MATMGGLRRLLQTPNIQIQFFHVLEVSAKWGVRVDVRVYRLLLLIFMHVKIQEMQLSEHEFNCLLVDLIHNV